MTGKLSKEVTLEWMKGKHKTLGRGWLLRSQGEDAPALCPSVSDRQRSSPIPSSHTPHYVVRFKSTSGICLQSRRKGRQWRVSRWFQSQPVLSLLVCPDLTLSKQRVRREYFQLTSPEPPALPSLRPEVWTWNSLASPSGRVLDAPWAQEEPLGRLLGQASDNGRQRIPSRCME